MVKPLRPARATAITLLSTAALTGATSASAADLILNEYNAVDSDLFLEDAASDVFWGTRVGNGGDWFELVVITDHLDAGGWELLVVNRSGDVLNEESFSLRLTDENVWSDLRSGTIVTISEQLGHNAGDYEPAAGRWWLNVRAGGDTGGRFVTATCISPACDPSNVNWKVSNSNWQLTIRDAGGAVVFGPAGEGVAPLTGVGSAEVVKLEANPTASTTPLSNYQDGSSSSFGQPNVFDAGANMQDLGALRSVVPYSPLATVRVNEVFSHSDPGDDWVELYNTTAAPVDVSGWFLSDSFSNLTKFQIPPGTTIAAGGYLVYFESELGFALSSACGDELILSAGDGVVPTGPRDFAEFGAVETGVAFGRTPDGLGPIVRLASATMGAANATLFPAPVVINELMYNPPDPGLGVSVVPEFVELHNTTDLPVEMFTRFGLDGTFGWQLRGGVDFEFAIGTELEAREFLVLVNFDPASRPDLLAEFRTLYDLDASVRILGPYDGALNNFSDVVRLAKPDTPESNGAICGGSAPGPFVPSVVIDEVEYVDFDPWPAEADGSGASLERASPTTVGNDPSSWLADPVLGPTPGRRNTGSPTTTLPEPECMNDTECDDGNECTEDTCDGRLQCRNGNVDVACDDGLSCTTADVCSGGSCVGSPPCEARCSRCSGAACVPLCGAPVSRGDSPVVTDALFILQVAVGISACDGCVCDVDDSGTISVTDAFRVLSRAVGIDIQIACPAA